MENVNLKTRIASGTLVYVGRRQLRHATEPNEKQEWMFENCPEAYPHTFVDFSGAKLLDVFEHAGGKQGCVVDTQKVVRDKSTINEVNAWRDTFDIAQWADRIDGCVNIDETALDEIASGVPFVVIRFTESGAKLDVPMQPEDLLDHVKDVAPEIFAALFAGLSHDEQLVKVVEIQDQLHALGVK